MRRFFITAAFLLSAVFAFAGVCPNGISLLEFQLIAEPEDGGIGHALRTVNRLEAKQKVIYAPIIRYPEELNDAKVALVMLPANSTTKLVVLEPKPAGALAEWKVPFRTSVVAFVYGPQGLDAKRVTSLASRDRQFIEQLADYAEQTARTETLITALANWDRTPSATENLNAALAGFSSGYGNAAKLDRNASPDQQVATLLRTLNPALATIDPLAPESRQKMQQSALLASSVAGMFFGSPVGLAAGGAALFVNLSNLIFPDTDFRSAFVQPASAYSGMMCVNRDRPKSRTRMAYLWGVRVPDADPPASSFRGTAHLLIGARTPARVNVEGRDGWKNLDRVADWSLLDTESEVAVPITVKARPETESLEIDLRGVQVKPGRYKLRGKWDWQRFEVAGGLSLHQLHDVHKPQLAPGVSDRLVKGAGRVPIELRGIDFEFLEKLEIDQTAILDFKLPDGPRAGPQFDVQSSIDTTTLAPGSYRLVLHFPEGMTRELPIRILPPNPTLDGLPIRVNLGEPAQDVILRGTGLDRIERIESSAAVIELGQCQGLGPRSVTVRMNEGAQRGDRIDLRLKVEGLESPLEVPRAFEVIGPRPRITSAQASLPGDLGMQLGEGELPAGSFASFSLRVQPLESSPSVKVTCSEAALAFRTETVRIGEERGGVRVQNAGAGALFLSLEPGTIGQPGCGVTAAVSTDAQGSSDPYVLGKVVRLPRIDGFELTDQKQGDAGYIAILKGEDLEVIDRVGWDSRTGVPVTDLPAPAATGGRKQTLKVTMPWPSPAPHAPAYVWLRGESKGRATAARY